MADRTLTINHADGDSETYTINRDKFAGVRSMSVDGDTVTVDHTAIPKEQSKETTFGGSKSITIKREIEPLLSEVVGGASAAYSLRDLNDKAGNNKVVRVRRASDNDEKDFKAKEVSKGTLVTWVGAGNDGFVETWYDQSGNSNDATQQVSGSQPKIVDAGVLVSGGIEFDGVNDYLVTTQGYIVELSQNPASVFCVASPDNANQGYLLTEGDRISPYSSQFILNGDGNGSNTVWVNGTVFGSGFPASKALGGFIYDGTEFQAYMNGYADGSAGTPTINTELFNRTVIGARADGTTFFFAGKVEELITYKSDQSANREAIEANINNQYDIY